MISLCSAASTDFPAIDTDTDMLIRDLLGHCHGEDRVVSLAAFQALHICVPDGKLCIQKAVASSMLGLLESLQLSESKWAWKSEAMEQLRYFLRSLSRGERQQWAISLLNVLKRDTDPGHQQLIISNLQILLSADAEPA